MERNAVTGTSVDHILRARTSKGAFFHHFDSKRELTAALMERACLYIAALSERDLLSGPVHAAVLRDHHLAA